MSIAAGTAATSHKTVAGAENHGHKARSPAVGQADGLGSGGFLALLMSMDPETDLGTEAAGGMDQGAGLALPMVAQDPASGQTVQSPSPPLTVAQNPRQDLAMLLAQARVGMGGAGAMDRLAGLAPPQASRAEPAPGLIAPQNLVMSQVQAPVDGAGTTSQLTGFGNTPIAMPDSLPASMLQPSKLPQDFVMPSAQVAEDSGVVTPQLAVTPSLHPELAAGLGKPEPAVEHTVVAMSEGAEAGERNVELLAGQTEQLLPLRPSKGKGTELQARAGGGLLESRFSSLMETSLREPAMLGALVNSDVGDGFLPQVDRPAARSSARPGGDGVEGVWGQQTLFAGAGVDASVANTDPSMSSLESMVADTVSYWVTQGVQNAELKLDGLGADPVDVSISLRGDEAHIDFRTDQPEIRQVLEGAVAHLKELLAKEGLVLSGVSVGTSSQHGAGAQDQRHRQGARQANIASVEVLPTESRPRSIPSQARAVDIFV